MNNRYFAILAIFGIAGCTNSHQQGPAVAEISSDAVTVTEASEFYKPPRTLPSDLPKAKVDYQSELRFTIDPSKLIPASTPSASILPALTPAAKAQLDALSDLTAKGRAYLDAFTMYHNERAKLHAAGGGDQVAKQAVLNLRKVQANAGLALFDAFDNYVAAVSAAKGPVAAANLKLTTIAPPVAGQGIPLDFPGLSKYIAGESDEILKQAAQDAKAAQSAALYLRVRATLSQNGGAQTPVHILNYDSLQDANVQQEPRVSFKMSDADRQRLQSESEVNSNLAQLINDARGKSGGQTLDTILNTLRGDLKGWQTASKNADDLDAKLTDILNALNTASASAQVTGDPTLKTQIDDFTKSVTQAQADLKIIRTALSKVANSNSVDTDPSDVLLKAADAASDAADAVADLVRTSQAGLTTIIATANAIETKINALLANDKPNLQALATAIAPTATAAITKLISDSLGQYPALASAISRAIANQQSAGAAGALSPIEVDPNLIDISVSSAPVGKISLASNAVGGQLLTLDASTFSRATPNGPATGVTSFEHETYDVEKFGWANEWSANLVFVERLGTNKKGSTERFDSFQAAASIGWTLHYSPIPDATTGRIKDGLDKWINDLDPGIGLDVTALNFSPTGSGVQVGVGGHASIFDDLITIGGGVDLNEKHHPGYFFVGIGIFEALGKLGINTTAASTVGR